MKLYCGCCGNRFGFLLDDIEDWHIDNKEIRCNNVPVYLMVEWEDDEGGPQ